LARESDTGQERTIPATQRRREEARKKGQVAKSREVNSAVILLAALASLSLLAPTLLREIGNTFGFFIAAPHYANLTKADVPGLLMLAMERFFIILSPFLIVMVIVSVLVNVLQVGFLLSSEAIQPKGERINPVEGFKRLFSKRSLMELLKSILKIFVVGYVCFYTIRQAIPQLATLSDRGLNDIFYFLGVIGFRVGIRAAIVLIVIAVIDYAFQRYDFEESIMMTQEEFKQEMKQMEGDPHVRARIRSIQREMARKRMMEMVPEADVVITNPTEYAVALQYKPAENPAPVVIAKGQRLIARKIRDLARENGVPIVEDPPLARALFKEAEVGDAIPEGLYRAVAEVLAYVYRLEKSRKRMAQAMA
jgi:flagellar biosynthesis protein FlhB